MLRHVPIGPGQAEAPVGPPRTGGPDLGPVEHPFVAVADRTGQGPGHVRTTARLGEELHPDLLALQDGRDVPALLLLGAEVEEHGGAGRQRGGLQPGRELVAGQLLVQHRLMGRGEPLTAVGTGEADAGQPGLEEHALDLPLPCDRGQLLLVVAVVAERPDRGVRGEGGQVGARERTRPLPEGLEVLHLHHPVPVHVLVPVHGRHASLFFSVMSARRWRWSAGVP